MVTDPTGEEFAHALMVVHRADLHAYVCRLMREDHSQAEDVVQETMLRAWQHRLSIDPDALRPWLFRVARNHAIDLWRRRPPVADHALAGDPADPLQENAFEDVLQVSVTLSMLRQLSPEHREVLVHLYCRDLSQAQTARALGLAEGTVKSRAHYAIHQLRSLGRPGPLTCAAAAPDGTSLVTSRRSS